MTPYLTKEEKAEYDKKRRLENLEKFREKDRIRYEKRKSKHLEYMKEYSATHKEQIKEYNKKYRKEHKEELQNKDKIRHIMNREKRIEYSKKYYKEHYDELNERNKKRAKEKEQWYIEFKKSLSCSKCGENHIACLEFHHMNPKEKDFCISRLRLRTPETILKEVEKCIVLCKNCHAKLHYEERKDA